uniref:Ovule protein n=1 Tax=Syphacia muris TaxID=451379 RepID=A0A0N5ARS1_9BILA
MATAVGSSDCKTQMHSDASYVSQPSSSSVSLASTQLRCSSTTSNFFLIDDDTYPCLLLFLSSFYIAVVDSA